ncbi:Exocyst complex component EXO84B-like protein [Drosera capensis]
MASAKTPPRQPRVPAKENGGVGVSGVKVEETLSLFKADRFDAESYVQSKCSLNDKEIRHLCTYLLELKKASAEEMRKSVYANYSAFIKTSKEISDLEAELLSIRNLLSAQASLIHGLAEGVNLDSLEGSEEEGSVPNGVSNSEYREPSDLEKWLTDYPDLLDVLLAERRVDEVLKALDHGTEVASEAKEMNTVDPDAIISLQNTISGRKQKLADQLAEAACQPSTRGSELRTAVRALKRLGDGPRAHTLLLDAHLQRYQYNMQSLCPSSSSYGGAYTAALSQLVFSAIGQAVSDSLAIFGEESAYTSELVVWASKQTKAFGELVKRHALASSAAAGGLRAAAECVQIALGHCSLLEARGLSLCPVLVKLFGPSVEQAIDANLKRIEENTAALTAADDWVLTYPQTVAHQHGRLASVSGTSAYNYKLTSSAHRFNSMVQDTRMLKLLLIELPVCYELQDLFDDVGPLLSMHLGSKALEGVYQVFNSYVNMLIKALPNSIDEETTLEGNANKIVRIAENEAQQIALLANASMSAEELLPRAAMKLTVSQGGNHDDFRRRPSDRQSRHPEQREWKRRLVASVERLKSSFCQQHALDLIFTEEGDTNLAATTYIDMDGNEDEIEWCPSLIFQELFLKLNRMASIAAEMFVGRERFATLLLMKLTETVVLWLSQDQSFWDDIEDGPKPLGSLGLRQVLYSDPLLFYLDMKFVILFASQGRYLSRNLVRVLNEVISKAMGAYATTGMDPNSVLPEDSWFDEICQEAVERLSGRPRLAAGDRDPNSPTASVSAQSVSSIRSHGSV